MQNWVGGKPAAFNFTITSAKCSEFGWGCLPLAVETCGNWGKEVVNTFVLLAAE